MKTITRRLVPTIGAAVALSLGGIGVAQASNGADDPPGHDAGHHHGNHHHGGNHHGNHHNGNHHNGGHHGGGNNPDGPNHT